MHVGVPKNGHAPISWNAQRVPLWLNRVHLIADGWHNAIAALAIGAETVPSNQKFICNLTEQIIVLLLDDGCDKESARTIGALLAERFGELQVMSKTQTVLPPLLLEGIPESQQVTLLLRIHELLSEVMVGFIQERNRALQHAHHTFLSHMRHELGTPLTAVTGFSYIMLKGLDGPLTELQRRDLEAIQQAGQHLIDMLNDMADISKVEVGRLRMQATTLKLTPFLESLRAEMQEVLCKNGNELKLEIAPSLGMIFTDKRKLGQVLRSLLSHMSWSTRDDSLLLEAVQEENDQGSWIRLRLTDGGVGLTPLQLQQLQNNDPDKELSLAMEAGGPGLGLLLCQRFCHLLGARFQVMGEEGKGATYTIWLRQPKVEE